MQCLNDHWTYQVEQLGYETFALKTRQLILNADTPIAMTISGRWGAGKTSMLRTLMGSLGGVECKTQLSQLEKLPSSLRINGNNNTWTVWFNPWQYQHEPNPLIPLLHEIRNQIRLMATLKKGAKEITVDAFDIAIRSLGSLIDNGINMLFMRKVVDIGQRWNENIDKQQDQRAKAHFTDPVDAQRFFQEFEKAINLVVGEKGRLVIFIDDLDRCSDHTTFALLEQIKLYLASKHCVFVFGLDRIHVEAAVARAGHYNLSEARQYVEKIFQARLYLPHPKPTHLAGFVKTQLKQLGLDDALQEKLQENIPTNPRVIKNLLNGYSQYRQLLEEEQVDDEQSVMMFLFRFYHPDAYELLLQNPQDITHIQHVLNGSEIDPNDGMQRYLNFLLENSIKRSNCVTTPEASDNIAPQMDEQEFHKVRANAWQADCLDAFHKSFVEAFPNEQDLRSYLV